MARNRVTLRDVAAAAGVSSGTASNALNGSPLVRPATSSRVLEAARRLNYAPDRRSGRPRQGTTGCIAVAFTSRWPTMTGATFYALVVRGITDVLEEHGYTSRLIRVEDDAQLPQARGARRSLTTQEIDGLIVLNWQDSALMNQLCGLGVPLVAVDTSGAYPGEPSVDNDDRGGVASGVAHLIGLGHRRIAFVNSHLAAPFGREALAGYLRACEQHRLVVEPWLMRTSDFTVAGGRAAMGELLAGAQPPTAVFAVDDETAVGAIQAIQEAGLRVPDDISVVGMDDIPLAAAVRPALTTVRIELEALGRRAAEMVVEANTGTLLEPGRVVLPTRLVVRDSAAPIDPQEPTRSDASGALCTAVPNSDRSIR